MVPSLLGQLDPTMGSVSTGHNQSLEHTQAQEPGGTISNPGSVTKLTAHCALISVSETGKSSSCLSEFYKD
jgi:hypothetical protein